MRKRGEWFWAKSAGSAPGVLIPSQMNMPGIFFW